MSKSKTASIPLLIIVVLLAVGAYFGINKAVLWYNLNEVQKETKKYIDESTMKNAQDQETLAKEEASKAGMTPEEMAAAEKKKRDSMSMPIAPVAVSDTKPAAKPEEKPADKPADKPEEKPADKPEEKTAGDGK